MAMMQLLLEHYETLRRHIEARIPAHLRRVFSAEDVLQEALPIVCKSIRNFNPVHSGSFPAWLKMIAEHKLLDRQKAEEAVKRGGGKVCVSDQASFASGSAKLLRIVAQDSRTPSRSIERRERERALQVALAGLPDDYRQVIQWMCLEELPASVVAKRMNRSIGAVYMLCQRAKFALREILGNTSQFFSVG